MEIHRNAFYKKTRRGKVVRIVQEKYLRTDMACGFLLCTKNNDDSSSSVQKSVLPLTASDLQDLVSKSPHRHLLVIDSNICLHQIDLLEYDCPATSHVVVTQTVLHEIRHRNLSVYRRVSALLKDPNRMFIFYANELSAETATLRVAKETANDYNDRSIVQCALFYQRCCCTPSQKETIADPEANQVVFITNDAGNRKRAESEQLASYSMQDYVSKFLHEYPELADLVASDDQSETIANGSAANLFPPHYPMDEVQAGIKSRKFLRGTLRCRGLGFTDCYAVVHSAGETRTSVNVMGRLNCNRAMDGDVVALEILPDDEIVVDDVMDMEDAVQQQQLDNQRSSGCAGMSNENAEPSVEALEGLSKPQKAKAVAGAGKKGRDDGGGILNGRVVGIIRRNWKQYAGTLNTSASGMSKMTEGQGLPVAKGGGGAGNVEGGAAASSSTLVQFLPVSKKVPPVWIATRRLEELSGFRLIVQIDSWPASSLYPYGHYVSVLGKDGDKSVETQVLLHEFDVPHEDFSPDVMACLPPKGWAITEDVVAQRTDLRHIPVVSIDPPGCKDIDDALHCVRMPNGRLECGVHIADVSHFVHPGTPIDKEAAHRSTSTYLVERRLDMLPGYLTTELCSLRSKEDHLAFSVIWEMDDEGNIHDVKFMKSCIHSVASLTYDEAQVMLDAPDPTDQVSTSVNLLGHLARILRQKRIEMGALTLASPEVRFKLDVESQNPIDVSVYSLKEANALVEEWMLLANITVSKQMLRHYPTLAILRRHQPPSREQFTPLLSAANAVGVSLDISSSKTLADSLDAAVRNEDPYFNKLLRILSTRCMMPAQYFCSGEIPKDQWHHYGLAAPVYTHFTSPIRRYADVLVHRLLSASIGVIALPAENADRSKQQETCSHMNRRHRSAQHVQRASVGLHTLIYFRDKPSIETAYVLTVTQETFSVLVPRFGIEGSIVWGAVQRAMEKQVLGIKQSGSGSSTGATRLELDPIAHKMSLISNGSSGGSSGGDVDGGKPSKKAKGEKKAVSSGGRIVLALQVFQPVQISIKVKGGDGSERRLVIALMHNGVELEDETEEDQRLMEVEV